MEMQKQEIHSQHNINKLHVYVGNIQHVPLPAFEVQLNMGAVSNVASGERFTDSQIIVSQSYSCILSWCCTVSKSVGN